MNPDSDATPSDPNPAPLFPGVDEPAAAPTPPPASAGEPLPELNPKMKQHAEEAVEHARTTFGAELDGTRESIELLETIAYSIERLLGEEGETLAPDEFEILCTIYGAYLGEVVRKSLGGTWVYDLEVAPGSAVIALKLSHGRIFPPMKWARRLEQGEAEDLRVFVARVENRGKLPAEDGEKEGGA